MKLKYRSEDRDDKIIVWSKKSAYLYSFQQLINENNQKDRSIYKTYNFNKGKRRIERFQYKGAENFRQRRRSVGVTRRSKLSSSAGQIGKSEGGYISIGSGKEKKVKHLIFQPFYMN